MGIGRSVSTYTEIPHLNRKRHFLRLFKIRSKICREHYYWRIFEIQTIVALDKNVTFILANETNIIPSFIHMMAAIMVTIGYRLAPRLSGRLIRASIIRGLLRWKFSYIFHLLLCIPRVHLFHIFMVIFTFKCRGVFNYVITRIISQREEYPRPNNPSDMLLPRTKGFEHLVKIFEKSTAHQLYDLYDLVMT